MSSDPKLLSTTENEHQEERDGRIHVRTEKRVRLADLECTVAAATLARVLNNALLFTGKHPSDPGTNAVRLSIGTDADKLLVLATDRFVVSSETADLVTAGSEGMGLPPQPGRFFLRRADAVRLVRSVSRQMWQPVHLRVSKEHHTTTWRVQGGLDPARSVSHTTFHLAVEGTDPGHAVELAFTQAAGDLDVDYHRIVGNPIPRSSAHSLIGTATFQLSRTHLARFGRVVPYEHGAELELTPALGGPATIRIGDRFLAFFSPLRGLPESNAEEPVA